MFMMMIVCKKDLRFYIPFAPKLICVRHWRAAPALIITTCNITVQKKAGNKRTLHLPYLLY